MKRSGFVAGVALMIVAAGPTSAAADSSVALSGDTTYAAIEARTGEYAGDPNFWGPGNALMDPEFNRCTATAELEMTDKNTAVLKLVENCFGQLRPVDFDVHVTPSGKVKMAPQDPDGFTAGFAGATGCAFNGPFPTYFGTFDGATFKVTTHFHGICDGGSFWGPNGITAETGPIHATLGIDLGPPAP